MAIKFQVFVSSTFEDLRKEREQVLKATLELGHIPVGMEMFSAADEEQWKIITRQIDECDYYAVIVAHRYGSTVAGVSYTEKEYDYALSRGVPVLGFVIESNASWPADCIDTAEEGKIALDLFKAKVKQKPVNFWTSASDLHGKFSISLTKQIASTPRPGWARATEVSGPAVVQELARLSGENAKLRQQLADALHQAEDDAFAERCRTIEKMKTNWVPLSFRYKNGTEWEDKITVTLFSLFNLLAPEMMIEKTTEDIALYIGVTRLPDKKRKPRSHYPVPANTVNSLISDFIVLGAIEPSQKRHTVSDTKDYWSLTSLGREIYTQIRGAILGANDEIVEQNEVTASVDAPAPTENSKTKRKKAKRKANKKN